MRDLEEVAQSFDGVRDAYAINAGREVRVMVNAGRVNDEQAKNLSFSIAERIREEMTYPGEVQITVIRQTIATDWVGRPSKRRNRPRGRGRRYDRRGRNGKNGSYRNRGFSKDGKKNKPNAHKGEAGGAPSSVQASA